MSISQHLTLKDLEYLLAVDRHRNFSQAAVACQVSQPALSKQIKRIETTLGVRLFERNKRQVFPTETGERFIQQARIVMDEAERLMHIAGRDKGPLYGTFHLGVIASSCPYLLPHFVGELADAYPDLRLVVKEGLTEHLVRELRQGKLDAVIAAPTFEDDLIGQIPLFFEPFLLAQSREATEQSKATVSIGDIDPQRLLLLEDGHCLKDQTVELCAIQEHSPSLNFRATSLETLLHMTAGGMGVSVIPALSVPGDTRLGTRLRFSPFRDKTLGRVMALFYRRSYPQPENLHLLAGFIREHLPADVRPVME